MKIWEGEGSERVEEEVAGDVEDDDEEYRGTEIT